MWRFLAWLSACVPKAALRHSRGAEGRVGGGTVGRLLAGLGLGVAALIVAASPIAVAQQSIPPSSSLALPGSARAPAPNTHQTDNVRSALIAARASVAPGERFLVALRQTIRSGWHTYWENPGDSGLPAQFTWTLPEGASAGAIQWPAPRRFPVGPLMNYGYADEATLLVEIAAPPDARQGQRLDLQLDAAWLVCAEICIPEDARLTLSIPIGPSAPSADAGLIEAARAALPQASPWQAVVGASAGKLLLRIDAPGLDPRAIRDAYFFARDTAAIEHAAPQSLSIGKDGLTLTMTPGEGRRGRAPEALDGVLSIVERTGGGETRLAFALAARPGIVALPAAAMGVGAPSLWQALLLAFLGGIVLNLMPCVFPVLSMKALALLGGHAGGGAARRREAIGYAAGVVASFAAIAAVMLAMRGAGEELGWGFQFQSPVFVALLAYVMLAVGLNLSGVFDVSIGAVTGTAQTRSAGGAFFTGLLAVVVATPCTAPFMGAALGVALAAEAPVMLAILFALAIGFAAPFVAVASTPALATWLPRPGAWMLRLKQLLAFPMYATAAWLLWVLSQQVDATAFAWALAGLVCVGFAAWVHGSFAGGALRWPRVAGIAALAVAVVLAAQLNAAAPRAAAPQASAPAGGLPSEAFSEARLGELRRDGRTVFVNMTAAWCITCLFNERSTLASPRVHAAFADGRVVYMKGDWTNRDAGISAFLRGFGRSGVPLYVVYRPDRAPDLLPQILTESVVLEALGAAS